MSLERRSVGGRVLGPVRSPRLSALSPFSPVSASLAPLCGAYGGRLWLSAGRLAQSLVGISWCRMVRFLRNVVARSCRPVGGPMVCGRRDSCPFLSSRPAHVPGSVRVPAVCVWLSWGRVVTVCVLAGS